MTIFSMALVFRRISIGEAIAPSTISSELGLAYIAAAIALPILIVGVTCVVAGILKRHKSRIRNID
jgi:hypothetical protein